MRVLRVIRPHLTYANVTSTVVLFLVLGGGGAYALSGHNSVRTDDIAKGQVRTSDLAGSAVTGTRVKDDSLSPGDVDSIVAQPSGDADVSTAAPGAEVPYPLENADWTQPAGEVEMLDGTVTYRTPSAACLEFGSPDTFGSGRLNLELADGVAVGSAYLSTLPLNTVKTSPITVAPLIAGGGGPPFLFSSGADVGRTLSATATDLCAGSTNFVVQSVNISVIGVG